MPRARNPKRDEAKKMWLDSGKKKPLKDIAKELGLSASQVRKWKSEDNWSESKRNVTNHEKERYQSMSGNKNAAGNSGGPPPNNKNAVSHGLFAKWLPDDTADLITELYSSKPADILWNNIMIQYTAIIRAQKIMYVKDVDDETVDNVGLSVTPWMSKETGQPIPTSVTRNIQHAWDKQAGFLAAQSRAMGTLSNLIKQFLTVADDNDERRKRLALMDAQIGRVKEDTRIAKHKADELEGVGRTNPLLVALNKQAKNLLPKDGDADADTTE